MPHQVTQAGAGLALLGDELLDVLHLFPITDRLMRTGLGQADLAIVRVDVQDADRQLGTHSVGALPVSITVGQLGDVNQTLDTIFELNEHAKVSDVNNGAFQDLSKEVASLSGEPRVLGQLLDPQGEALAVAIDVEHACLHLIALLEAIRGVTQALAPGQVTDVNQAVDAILDTDKDAEVGDVADLALDDDAYGVTILDAVPRVLFELTHAQGNPLVLHIDTQNLSFDHVGNRHELGGVLDALVPSHLGDVNQTLDTVLEFDECTVVGDGNDLSADDGSDGVLVVHLVPWIWTHLLVAQGDALAVAVELEDLDLDGLANFEHLGGVIDAAVAHVGDVQQSIDSAQVHEGAVVGDVLDDTVHDGANTQATDGIHALGLALFLKQHPARQHDVAAALVELDDAEVEGFADQLVEVLDWTQVHLATRQECLDADVDGQTTLDASNHDTVDGLVGLDRLGDLVPGLHQVGLFLGELELSVFLGHVAQEYIDFVANGDGRDAVLVLELMERDAAFGLVAHVHGHPVAFKCDHVALDDRLLLDVGGLKVIVKVRLEVIAGKVSEVGVEINCGHLVPALMCRDWPKEGVEVGYLVHRRQRSTRPPGVMDTGAGKNSLARGARPYRPGIAPSTVDCAPLTGQSDDVPCHGLWRQRSGIQVNRVRGLFERSRGTTGILVVPSSQLLLNLRDRLLNAPANQFRVSALRTHHQFGVHEHLERRVWQHHGPNVPTIQNHPFPLRQATLYSEQRSTHHRLDRHARGPLTDDLRSNGL